MRKSLLFASCLLLSSACAAATAFWSGTLTGVEQNSNNRTGYEDDTVLDFSGSFAGTSCSSDGAYFNARDNPHLAALAMSAKLTHRQVRLFVDDTKPKFAGLYCQVLNAQLQ